MITTLTPENETYTVSDDMKNVIEHLHKAFPTGYISNKGEFIACSKTNQYFLITGCRTELDIKCKILEWLSRAAYKSEPYSSKGKNQELHHYIANGINEFLETNFTEEDFDIIYTYLGNCINHAKTIQFVESGYNLSVLTRR